MQKEKSILVLFLLNMKSMEGRCLLVTSIRSIRRRPTTAWEPYTCLHLGKHVCHMEPGLASYDGLDLYS
jgi:hypothetical protein